MLEATSLAAGVTACWI